ncbi:cytochrome p450 [Trifolium pratense]|uniref:Cytochrome p450 n=1 Tax=Trifolium pratense TaxID=57577 RepID=A0A2K3JUA5_TRIPR|nr:cytochrome p450 [Trifolium pratense]
MLAHIGPASQPAIRNYNSNKPPPTEFLRCNVDAALFTISNQVSMGACIRDEKGRFLAATTRYINAKKNDTGRRRSMGLQQAMTWMGMFGYHKVIFHMDCKMVVDDAHNKKYNLSEYGSLIDDCRTILSNYSNFIVAFTRRQANGSAHALA